MAASSPVVLLSRKLRQSLGLASHTFTQLNFGTSKTILPVGHDLVDGLPMVKYGKGHFCSACIKEENGRKLLHHSIYTIEQRISKKIWQTTVGFKSMQDEMYLFRDFKLAIYAFPQTRRKNVSALKLDRNGNVIDFEIHFRLLLLDIEAIRDIMATVEKSSIRFWQEPSEWYDKLSSFLIEHGFNKVIIMAKQHAADVHPEERCPLNKRYDLMDANKKVDLKHVQCLPESKILTNIIKNHPLRFNIAASSFVPWIYMVTVMLNLSPRHRFAAGSDMVSPRGGEEYDEEVEVTHVVIPCQFLCLTKSLKEERGHSSSGNQEQEDDMIFGMILML
ncbi:hypothetical protein Tco_1109321 [Tanacetum coccineum]